ncbi:MAG: NHL repeat-containing protein [Acidobacteria bacterium OLB17]|nr:MAG: NHL repeat-containing protein [Acidobacteria bacterium OLB17]MCZ2391031.1 PQQ-dependent sugar dehydrogenase [Acidobacteriota bacterium]
MKRPAKAALIAAIFALAVLAQHGIAQTRLTPHKVQLKNGRAFTLNLPEDLEIIPAAEGLKRVRFFAKSPDGRVFVTDMYNLTDNKRGAVYILDGFDERTGKFARVIPYMTGLRNPNSCQFYTDASGQAWFYLAETHQLTRRRFTPGETRPSDDKPEVLATFPDYGLSYKYGGWHLTRTLAFAPNGRLYVSVGSSCDACVEKEKVRASVISMEPDGTDQREIASGLRNAVGMRVIDGQVYVTGQGVDHLGLNKPDEVFYALKEGTDYGWPYCYSSKGRVYRDPKFKRAAGCRDVPAPYAYFPAHASALGFDHFSEADTDPILKDAFLVSLHGSTNKRVGHGYKVVLMRKGKPLEDFITGFLKKGTVFGRPCDIMKIGTNAFLLTDDNKGIVYLVRKKGTTPTIAATHEPSPKSPANTTESKIEQKPTAPSSGSACLGAAFVLFASLLTKGI